MIAWFWFCPGFGTARWMERDTLTTTYTHGAVGNYVVYSGVIPLRLSKHLRSSREEICCPLVSSSGNRSVPRVQRRPGSCRNHLIRCRPAMFGFDVPELMHYDRMWVICKRRVIGGRVTPEQPGPLAVLRFPALFLLPNPRGARTPHCTMTPRPSTWQASETVGSAHVAGSDPAPVLRSETSTEYECGVHQTKSGSSRSRRQHCSHALLAFQTVRLSVDISYLNSH